MSLAFVVLAAAAFELTATATAIGVALGIPLAGGAMARLAPSARSRLWLVIALAPCLVAGAVVLAATTPALGLLADHCQVHGDHHPHLCPTHAHVDSWVLGLFALLLLARTVGAVARGARTALESRGTWRRLVESSRAVSGTVRCLDDADRPVAVVIGLLRPRVFVSRSLLEGEHAPIARDAILGHERAHAERRDPLRLWLAQVALVFHLPIVSRRVLAALVRAQECAADADAARATGSAIQVAEALLHVARLRSIAPAASLPFAAGDELEPRVLELVSERRRIARPGWAGLVLGALLLAAGLLLASPSVHHAVEDLLGALGG